MTTNKDLLLAILSMDSYNRGYGQGIKDLPDTGRLGNALIKTRESSGIDDTEFADWEAAGFYAIAYDMTGVAGFGADERVISYRG